MVLTRGSSAASANPVPVLPVASPLPPETIYLWPKGAPGTESWVGAETVETWTLLGRPTKMVGNVTNPSLTVYRPRPDFANGTAMIVVPGGAFRWIATDHEGAAVADWLVARGITAFVLKYRVHQTPDWRAPADARRHPERFSTFLATQEPGRLVAVADATQAIRLIRASAAHFNVRPNRIGMIGFSAGAITAVSAAMNRSASDRPDFAAVIYGSMPAGAPPKNGPPIFVAAAADDDLIPALESATMFSRWEAAGLDAELHIYEHGGHGFALISQGLPVDHWIDALEAWLKSHAFLPDTVGPTKP